MSVNIQTKISQIGFDGIDFASNRYRRMAPGIRSATFTGSNEVTSNTALSDVDTTIRSAGCGPNVAKKYDLRRQGT